MSDQVTRKDLLDLEERLSKRWIDAEERLTKGWIDAEERLAKRIDERADETITKMLSAFHG